ncbi:MAG TPA: alpha/beta hydrolase, partial [Pirellula sp.]|nr:alpha/beta hydrolase [Pirellula sp.]
MKKMILLGVAIAIYSQIIEHGVAEQADVVMNLWTNDPPGERMTVGPEQDMSKETDKLIAGRPIIKMGNVKTPQAHVYLPPINIRTGASVVICPGGGFSILAWDLEGTEVAQWLTTQGITAVVLKYRVPTRNQEPSWLAPTQDAQRTMSLIRSRANEWKLDRNKIGILGFSAGGTTAVRASLAEKRLYDAIDNADKEACLPNRSILIYSGGLPGDIEASTLKTINVTEKTPPMFIVHAYDDFVPVQGAANMLLAMKKVGVPSELHIYDAGG